MFKSDVHKMLDSLGRLIPFSWEKPVEKEAGVEKRKGFQPSSLK